MAMLVAVPVDYGTCPAGLARPAASHAWLLIRDLATIHHAALPQQRARGQAGKAPQEESVEHHRMMLPQLLLRAPALPILRRSGSQRSR